MNQPLSPNRPLRSRAEMVSYLRSHFRYPTARSWNQCDSYAANVKLSRLFFPDAATRERAWQFLDLPAAWQPVEAHLDEFARRHDYVWQIARNGRSQGYFVLYAGGRRPSPYQSVCEECGQCNFRAAQPDDTRCGRCDADARVPYSGWDIFLYPYQSLDAEASFDEWSYDELRARVRLVRDFDRTVARAVQAFISFCQTHEAVTHTLWEPQTVLVAQPLPPIAAR